MPPKECLKPANREYVDYNAEYERDESPGSGDYPYYSSYSSHSSESDYDSLKGPRPDVGESPRAFRRRIGRVLKNVNITERIINCKPDTFHDANINTHLPDTELFDLILEDDQPDEPTKPVITTPETTKPDEITKPDKITKPASADQNVIVTTSETTTTSGSVLLPLLRCYSFLRLILNFLNPPSLSVRSSNFRGVFSRDRK